MLNIPDTRGLALLAGKPWLYKVGPKDAGLPYRNKIVAAPFKRGKTIGLSATFRHGIRDIFASRHTETGRAGLPSRPFHRCSADSGSPRGGLKVPRGKNHSGNHWMRGDQAGSDAKVGVGTGRSL
jgi:hypothetical protein